MDKENFTVAVATILTTVAEVGRAPQGHLYAGLSTRGIDLETFQNAVHFLVSHKYCRKQGWTLLPTKAGKELAAKVEAALAGGAQ